MANSSEVAYIFIYFYYTFIFVRLSSKHITIENVTRLISNIKMNVQNKKIIKIIDN